MFWRGVSGEEIFKLKPASIDFQRGIICLGTTKNKDSREAPVTPALRILLEASVAGKKPDDLLFPIKDARRAWRRICKAAGVSAGKNGGLFPMMRGAAQPEIKERVVFRPR
jgi:hypothetical protein